MSAMHVVIDDSRKPYVEYLDGRRRKKVSPKTRHALLQGAFVRIVAPIAEAAGFIGGPEWRFYPDPLGEKPTSFVPDIAFVARARLAAISPDEREKPPFSPDLAIEIRSPREDERYRARKIRRYLETGAILVLDLDPAARTLYATDALGTRAFGEPDRFEHRALPWLTFNLAELFVTIDAYEAR